MVFTIRRPLDPKSTKSFTPSNWSAPAYGPLHSLVIGDSLQIQDGMVLPPEKPGLGVELTDDVKNRFPFVPGSGEFNDVAGKLLDDHDERTAKLVDASRW